MKITLRAFLLFVPLLAALLLTSCAAPPARAEVAAPVSKLSPSNDILDLEAERLQVLWRQELGQLTDRSLKDVYCAGRFVVVEAAGGEIHCFDSSTGLWKTARVLRRGLVRPPVSLGNTLFLVVGSTVYGLDTSSGKMSDGYDPGFAIFASPVVYGSTLILPGGNGHLAQVWLVGAEQLLLTSIAGPIFEPPVIADGRVFAAAYRDTVVAVDLERGAELWTWLPKEPSRLTSGVAVSGDFLYVGDNRGYVYSLQAQHGALGGKKMVEGPVVGQPKIVGEKLLVFTGKPSLVCFKAGVRLRKLWSYGGAVQLLTAGQQVAYVLNDDHSVAALSLETGKELWQHPLPQDCRIAGDAARPVLYIANPQGSIVALGELD